MAFHGVVAPPYSALRSPPATVLLQSHTNSIPFQSPARHHLPPRLRRVSRSALNSDFPLPAGKGSSRFEEWDSATAKFAGASNIPFLLIQLPQILLNSRNLIAGDKAALLAVPWLGMLTGLLGNLTLLSYFVKKKENGAVLVQTLGVVSIYAVIAQLAAGGAMPLPQFVVTSAVVVVGLTVNFLRYHGRLLSRIWVLWEDFITVGGLAVLPQVMWSTFVPYIPNSILPGTISFIMAVAAVLMNLSIEVVESHALQKARTGKLFEKGVKFVGSISGWTATLLFMWMPIAQMWTNYLHPDNIKGLSAFTMLLGMIGNALMIPRALFIRDLMWFTGASWASLLHGWGNLVCMYSFKAISREFFLAASVGLFIWIGIVLWQDIVAYGYSSPLQSLKELISGT